MNYAAGRQFVSPGDSLSGAADAGALPWETGDDASLVKHDTWLLSFIDILALLLTLFVLLLAYQDDEMKQAESNFPAAEAFSLDFDMSLNTLGHIFRQAVLVPEDTRVTEGYAMPGPGLMPVDAGVEQSVPEDAVPVENDQEASQVMPAEDKLLADTGQARAEAVTADETVQADPVPDEEVQTRTVDAVDVLLEVFEASGLRDQVEVAVHPGEVNLEISDSILFPRGSAALTDAGLVLLKDLAEALDGQPYILSVEGHTDNIPIETARYPSNWELSSARAAVVTRKLVEQGIASDKVRAIGYGSTRPLADNASPEGRARNRRVSFVLQVDVTEGSQLTAALP